MNGSQAAAMLYLSRVTDAVVSNWRDFANEMKRDYHVNLVIIAERTEPASIDV